MDSWGIFNVFTLSPEASSGPWFLLCIPVAQGCCGLLLWQDIREGLVLYKALCYQPPSKVFQTRKYYLWTFARSHSKPPYCNAGPTESSETTHCTYSLQVQVITQYLI